MTQVSEPPRSCALLLPLLLLLLRCAQSSLSRPHSGSSEAFDARESSLSVPDIHPVSATISAAVPGWGQIVNLDSLTSFVYFVCSDLIVKYGYNILHLQL